MHYLPIAVGQDLTLKSLSWCKVCWFFRTSFICSSGYFTVFITLDRTLNSLCYHKHSWLKNYRNLLLLTALILVLSFLQTGLVQFWRYMRLVPTPACILSRVESVAFSLTIAANRVIPSVANFTMNIIIIRALNQSKRRVLAQNQSQSKENTFAFSIICQNFVFLILTLPIVIVSVIQIVVSLKNQTYTTYGAMINTLVSFCGWGTFFFEAFVFPIQLAFNKLFRAELLDMLGCKISFLVRQLPHTNQT